MPLLYMMTVLMGAQFALLHVLAEWLSLYWRYAWFDLPMHFFGGVVVMLMLATLSTIALGRERQLAPRLVGMLIIGILLAWEGFGVWRYGGVKPDFWSDSSLDLVFGILGVVAGYYVTTALRKLSL